MGELGLTGAPLPESVGGAGFSYVGWTLVMEELGAADMARGDVRRSTSLSQYPVLLGGEQHEHGSGRWLRVRRSAHSLGRTPAPTRAIGQGRARRRRRFRRWLQDLDLERAGPTATWSSRRWTRRPVGRSPRSSWKGFAGFSFGAHEKKMGIRSCPRRS